MHADTGALRCVRAVAVLLALAGALPAAAETETPPASATTAPPDTAPAHERERAPPPPPRPADDFTPTEKIDAGSAVSFPVDI